MSQVKWTELPGWQDDKAYEFLQNAPQTMIAWEFLRRKPEYRADYGFVAMLASAGEGWRTLPQAQVWEPPRLPNESKNAWMVRAAISGHEPSITPADAYYANKWGLQHLFDPLLPYTQGVRLLKPQRAFPWRIASSADFDKLLESVEIEHNGDQPMIPIWCVPLVFDLTRPHDAQIAAAEIILRKRKKLMFKHLPNTKGVNEKPAIWVRHLRVLDALRTKPKPTDEMISEFFGGAAAKCASREERRKQGGNFVAAARKKLRADHRNIMLTRGPGKKPLQT